MNTHRPEAFSSVHVNLLHTVKERGRWRPTQVELPAIVIIIKREVHSRLVEEMLPDDVINDPRHWRDALLRLAVKGLDSQEAIIEVV